MTHSTEFGIYWKNINPRKLISATISNKFGKHRRKLMTS